MRHFLDLSALSKADVRAILDEAHRRKQARAGWPKALPDADAPLNGYALAMIFQKNSTRTRVSFDIGIRQLGGVPIIMNASETQLGRGETVEDTARVLSRMVDAVMIRANNHQDVLDFAAASTAPVINGLTDLSHPCQILADIMTIEEWRGPIEGKTVAWLGDGNNVCMSFVHAAEKLPFTLRIATPPHYAPRRQEIEAAQKAGAQVRVTNDPHAAIAGADVVVTDTWVSMGDTDKDQRMKAFPPYAVDEVIMQRAAPDAIFLHCLPAHRGEEVMDAVMDAPNSAVWDEAENRIHAQKAVMLWCLGKI
ncbi:MAG TPA: ornithine carbamoyltransferase [Terricaulis sp.]|nr:ornithine carbamoyltransferase [Terricaulis sp.]